MKKNKLPKWFDGTLYPEGDTVTNPFSGESCKLNAEELSMYDYIMGCQMLIEMQGGPFNESSTEIQNQMREGLHWFKKINPKAYKKLLD